MVENNKEEKTKNNSNKIVFIYSNYSINYNDS